MEENKINDDGPAFPCTADSRPLDPREMLILDRLDRGSSLASVAKELGITRESVRLIAAVGREKVKVLHCGMSLRDWFAGMALASVASLVASAGDEAHFNTGDEFHASLGKIAYRIADAMLAARKK